MIKMEQKTIRTGVIVLMLLAGAFFINAAYQNLFHKEVTFTISNSGDGTPFTVTVPFTNHVIDNSGGLPISSGASITFTNTANIQTTLTYGFTTESTNPECDPTDDCTLTAKFENQPFSSGTAMNILALTSIGQPRNHVVDFALNCKSASCGQVITAWLELTPVV
jgi:hypothetical protein